MKPDKQYEEKEKKIKKKKEDKEEEKSSSLANKWYIKIFEPKKDRDRTYNANILKMTYVFLGLFLMLTVYFLHFVVIESPQVITSPYNKRQNSQAEKVERGKIISANDKVLAETVTDGEKETRRYPYENMFAHVVGYDIKGMSGLESACSYKLLGTDANLLSQAILSLQNKKNPGNNVVVSLDTRLQKAAYEALDGREGAVVAMEPSTGRILAMVSKPDFNPNTLKEDWDELTEEAGNSTLLNRAIQDLYPPGSTFKTVTALEYIKENPETYQDYSYDCEGSIIENGVIINCYQNAVHGTVDLKQSMAHSCNTSFVNIGSNLNVKSLYETCETLFFNKSISFDLPVRKSQYSLTRKTDRGQIPQTVIGQGETLITPLHNAMIMSAVANKGIMMKPTLVDRVESYKGKILSQTEAKEMGTVMTEKEAKTLRGMLRAVVKEGSAQILDHESYSVYGKTGSAEHGNTELTRAHAWFVGFSTSEDQSDMVVSIVVENAGTGREYAVPIAERLFSSYYNNELNKK